MQNQKWEEKKQSNLRIDWTSMARLFKQMNAFECVRASMCFDVGMLNYYN